jgi:hypothetical protein
MKGPIVRAIGQNNFIKGGGMVKGEMMGELVDDDRVDDLDRIMDELNRKGERMGLAAIGAIP